LPDHSINSIFKDSDGFMWFGTRNGLCRFDGIDFVTFRSDGQDNSIAGNRILSIAEDKSGFLWVGTNANGLCRLDRQLGKFTNFNQDHGIGNRVNRVVAFDDGALWICSNTGLARYMAEADSFEAYYHDPSDKQSLNFPSVNDIIKTRDGDIYVATEAKYIQKFDETKHTFQEVVYQRDPELGVNYSKRLLEGPDGIIYIIANIHGLATYDPKTGNSELFTAGNKELSTNVLSGDLAFDHLGNLWICTDGGGINVFDPREKKFTYFHHDDSDPESLVSDNVYSIFFDDENRGWIGSFDRGISVYDENRFKFSSTLFNENDLKLLDQKSVLSIYQDSEHRIWIGTDGDGLYRFEEKREVQIYKHNPLNKNSLTTNVITSLGEDASGRLLIGTYTGGLLSLNVNGNNFKRYLPSENSNDQINSSSIWKIKRDSKDRIWLGLLGQGVDRFFPDSETFQNYGPFSGRIERINFQNTMAISEDSDGDLWFGTEGGGIYIMDNQVGKTIRFEGGAYDPFFTTANIKCMYQDRGGHIWIGTEGDGLVRFNKKTGEIDDMSGDENPPGIIIQSIMEDALYNFWIGTNNGLSLLYPSNGRTISFFAEDGLSGNEFNQGAILQLADGRILMGTKTGANLISPESISLNQNLPRIVFNGLKILGKEAHVGDTINQRVILEKDITHTKELLIKYKDKNFSLAFTALNFTLPEKCLYRYRLEGFDVEWIYTNSQSREASYTNLRPGKYIFQVEASNNDGKWGNNREEMPIHVLAPFYKSLWFIVLISLIAVGIPLSMFYVRLQFIKSKFLHQQTIQDRRIIELENEKLERELQTLSIQKISRNRNLLDQKNRLMGLSLKARESVKDGLDRIIDEIDKELLDDKDWKYIEPQIDKVYNNFITRLKEIHTDLTLPEIKLAAYVRMGLSTKEISEFMQKSARGIESDRYRLRKKLGLEPNDSLSQYILNIR